MMKQLYVGKDVFCAVYFDEEKNEHYLDAICPGLVWWAKTIRLTDEEVEAFAQDPTSVDAIVLKICDDPGSFKGRRLPQAQADALREFGAKSKGP